MLIIAYHENLDQTRQKRAKGYFSTIIKYPAKHMVLRDGGGPEETRTLDLSDANRTLSQLSYRPIFDLCAR